MVESSEKQIVTYSRNQMFRVWDIAEEKCVKFFKSQHSIVLDIEMQNNLIAAGTSERTVCVYDYRKGYPTHVLRGHKGIITKVCFHPQAEKLQVIASSVDNSIRIWDLLMNTCVAVLGHSSPCSTFTFTPDGNTLLSAHRDKRIIVWNLLTKIKTANIEFDEEIEAMHYCTKHKSAHHLVTFGEKGIPRIFDLTTKEFVFNTPQHPPQPFMRCFYLKKANELVGVTTEQNLISYGLEFNESKIPQLVYKKDCVGFHDEILDVAYDLAHHRIILATNSTLLK